MSKGKKTPKPSSTADLSNWDDGLIKDQLGSGEWKPCVVIMSPENCEAENQLQLLQHTISSGVRKRFAVITKEQLLASARDDLKESAASSGGKKSKQAKNAPAAEKPAHLVVCEHTVQALDTGEVPASLVARMVKYKLLRLEKKEIQARAEAKAAEEAAKNVSAKGKGAGSKGGKNTSGSAKKAGKGGGKETPSAKESTEQIIPVPQKEPTKLRKRGEEDTALQTIDDEPTDGPDAYFILTGFDDGEVLEQLDLINVSVMMLVKLLAKDAGPPSAANEEEIEAYNKKNNSLLAFWKQLIQITSTNNEGSMLVNMTCNELTLPATIPCGDDQKAQYGSEAFDKLADMIYNTLDQCSIYQRYLNYTDYNKLMLYSAGTATTTEAVLSEPPSRVVTPLQSATSVDMSYYNKLLSHVPEDRTTVGLILHCMVEQVSVKCSGEDVMARLMEPVNGVEVGLSNYMSSLISGLALSDAHTTSLNGTSPSAPAHMTQSKHNKIIAPTILSNSDYISIHCHGLKDVSYFKISESAHSMLQLSLFQSLLMQQQSCEGSIDRFAAERHAIQHHCITGDLTQHSFYHYLFCLCFEQLPLNCGSNITGTKEPILFKFDTPLQLVTGLKSEGTLVPVDSDAAPPPSLPPPSTDGSTLEVSPPLWDMSQYEIQAVYDLPVLLQIVQRLYYQYPFTMIGTHQLTSSLLLAMHGGHDGKLLQRHTDSNQLHCKVGFSKFLTYVWDKYGEEVSKAADEDDERKRQFELQKEEEVAAVMKIIEEELKSKEEEQQRKSSAKGKTNSGKKSAIAQKSATKQDSTESKEDDERITEIRNRQLPSRKLYVGYEMGNKVLLVDHLTTTMYPLDGSLVRVRQKKIAEHDSTLDVCLLSWQSMLRCNLTISNASNQPVSQSATSNIKVLDGPKFPVKKGSFFASLDNGCLCISTSCYGPFADGKVAATVETPPATILETSQPDSVAGAQPSPRPGSRGQSPGRKISKKDLEMHEKQYQEQMRLAEEKKEKERVEREKQRQEKLLAERRQSKYLPLFVSLSNGLHVHCKVTIDLDCDPSIIDGSDGQFIIKQNYPLATTVANSNVKLRSIMSNGEVIKYFDDGTVEILTTDGRMMRTASPSEKNLMSSASEQLDQVGEMESATKVTFKDTELLPPVTEPPCPEDIVWMITLPTGERYLWKEVKVEVEKEEPPAEREPEEGQSTSVSAQGSIENEKPLETSSAVTEQQPSEEYRPVVFQLEQLDSYSATDPVTKEVMVTRVDNTVMLTRPDGTLMVEYSDGTRFTSHYNEQHQLTHWTVECKGYARTRWDTQTRVVSLEFDNGSNITCHTDGHYKVSTSCGTNLNLASDGGAIYQCTDDGVAYNMDHSGNKEILYATDKFGNKFIVSSSGVATVESSMEEDVVKAELHKVHPPQYFVVQPDNTAYQLLRKDDISVAMEMAKSHPQGAVVAKGNKTTIMMPFEQECEKRSPYREASIIPPNLQPFTIITQPTKQSNTTNKKFGSTVGKGLMIGAYQPPPKPKEVSVPSAIVVDQYLHYPPMSESVRSKVYRGLAQYIEWRDKQASELQALHPVDDRTKEECDKANKLVSQYSDQVTSSSITTTTDEYIAAITPPVEVQEQQPVSRATPQQLVDLRKEIAESAEAKKALRDRVTPPYFISAQGRKFLMSQLANVNITALSSKVPKGNKAHVSFQQDSRIRSPSEIELAVLKEDSCLSTPATNGANMGASGVESPTQSEIDKQVSSTSRPMNPTPSHASGHGTPTAIRPLNPTPLQATATPLGANNDSSSMLSIPMGANRPHNPTPARARQVDSRDSSYVGPLASSAPKMETMSFPMQEGSEGQEVGLPMQKVPVNRSTYFDVTGEMRAQPVKVPSFIKGARPGEIPNEKFRTIEEPVRRKVTISSLARKQERRGFVLLPEEVVFGVLKEGCSYDMTVTLRNTGVDSCRFKIKQPPPSTGLRVHYTPGPVAAGMKAEAKVEIFAMAIGSSSTNGVGTVEHLLEITTETSILHLPIQAIVLTADSYQNRKPIHPQGGPGRNVRLLTEKPISRDDFTRPAAKPQN